jgi:hypothetical protein
MRLDRSCRRVKERKDIGREKEGGVGAHSNVDQGIRKIK